MAEIPASVWAQYPLILIVVIAIFILLDRFQKFIDKRDVQWQNFLQEQRERDNTAVRALVDEIKCLASKLDNHDEKMDTAITRMEERTRPGKARKPV